jgi:penicillin-binding protein 2
VSVDRVFTREYRQGTIAAHLFGNVGEVTAEQLEQPRYQGLEQGDAVGQSGIEYEYDRFLRGRAGEVRTQVDALGNPTGQLASKPAQAGESVRLTLDADVQSYGESVISSFGLPGAFVAMNVNDGSIVAMGSVPSFDPDIFSRPLTQRQYKELTSEETDAPLANRAIQGLYPTGSVFKLVTAAAALRAQKITPGQIYNDTGVYTAPGDETLKFRNASDAVFGPVDMSDALKLSVDTYFYDLGWKTNVDKGRGGEIQEMARELGLGEPTGIDLPAETEGLIPSPAWRNRLFREGLTDRVWTGGDNINLAVGQGDLQANPLQMAIAYAAVANGGTVVTPHLAETVESVTGEVLQEIQTTPKREIEVPEETRSVIMEGLTRAAMEEGGTSFPVFGNFPMPVAGKTGTAERAPNPDQSWYIAVAPADNPEIVVAVTIERGGFGADAAAPVAARILEKYFQVPFTEPAGEPREATHE